MEQISFSEAVHAYSVIFQALIVSFRFFFFFLPKAIDYLLDPIPIMSAVTSFFVSALEWTQDVQQ